MTVMIAAALGAALILAAWYIPHQHHRHAPPPITDRPIISAREQINIQGWARRQYLLERDDIQQRHRTALDELRARNSPVLPRFPHPQRQDGQARKPPAAAATNPDLLQPVAPARRRITLPGGREETP